MSLPMLPCTAGFGTGATLWGGCRDRVALFKDADGNDCKGEVGSKDLCFGVETSDFEPEETGCISEAAAVVGVVREVREEGPCFAVAAAGLVRLAVLST